MGERLDLVDAYADHAAEQEARAAVEQPAQLDPPHVDGGVLLAAEQVHATLDAGTLALVQRKVSSPELASLAAKYLKLDADDIHVMLQPEQEALASAVRRLAASVLSQA